MNRDIFQSPSDLFSIHGEFYPASIRDGENIVCKWSTDGRKNTARVWRLSPFGIEFVDDGSQDLKVGQRFSGSITIERQTLPYEGVVVAAGYEERKTKLIAVRTQLVPSLQQSASQSGEERRGKTRWICNPLFYPSGHARTPGRFDDVMLFRVGNLASDSMELVTSLRNKHLLVGVEFEAEVLFPAVGRANLKMRVRSVRIEVENERDIQVIGAQLVDPSPSALATLGQYILQFGTLHHTEPSPAKLKSSGLSFKSVADAVEFDLVRSNADYEAVLELRHGAYMGAGRLDSSVTPADMADVYDAQARILVARFRGKIVATMRLVFPGPNDQFEQERYITFPDSFPRHEDTVEISRASTSDEFRGKDLLIGLFRYATLTVAQSGRKHILLCAHEELARIYLRLGFRDTGLRVEHGAFKNMPHMVCLADFDRFLKGSGNPLIWLTLFNSLFDQVHDDALGEMNWAASTRVALYKQLMPLHRKYSGALWDTLKKTDRIKIPTLKDTLTAAMKAARQIKPKP